MTHNLELSMLIEVPENSRLLSSYLDGRHLLPPMSVNHWFPTGLIPRGGETIVLSWFRGSRAPKHSIPSIIEEKNNYICGRKSNTSEKMS